MDISDTALRRVRRGAGLCFWGIILMAISWNASFETPGYHLHPFHAVGGVVVVGLVLLACAGFGRHASALALFAAAAMALSVGTLFVPQRVGQWLVPLAVATFVGGFACQYFLLSELALRCDMKRVGVELRYLIFFFVCMLVAAGAMFSARRLFPLDKAEETWRLEFFAGSVTLNAGAPGIVIVALFLLAAALAVACVAMLLRSYWLVRDWAVGQMLARAPKPPTHQA